tara:strand:+ start:1416 stop:2249 length:834 start_codon:yes stop_codon:yes gene_type:complete
MISSKNIGILLKIIKNSKGKKILYLVIKNKSIKKSNLKEYNIKISKKLIIYKFRINHFYKSILEILVPIIFNNNKLVLGQLGQSIDGRIALVNGNSHYINSSKSIIYLHCLRSLSDAIIVGSNTIKKDNPLLTTRKIKGENPIRIIIDTSLSLTNRYKVFKDGNRNIIFTNSKKNKKLNNSTIIRLRKRDFTKNLITELKKLNFKITLVEGGSRTISEFVNYKYIDLLQFLIAPIIIGSGVNSLNLFEIKKLNKAIRPKYTYSKLDKELLVNLFLNS